MSKIKTFLLCSLLATILFLIFLIVGVFKGIFLPIVKDLEYINMVWYIIIFTHLLSIVFLFILFCVYASYTLYECNKGEKCNE